jgi:hypothetical protein
MNTKLKYGSIPQRSGGAEKWRHTHMKIDKKTGKVKNLGFRLSSDPFIP